MKEKEIEFANIKLSNSKPFVLFGGLNVLETKSLGLQVAETFKNAVSYTHLTLPTNREV